MPTFEETHAYNGIIPSRVPLSSFVGRGCCENSIFKKNHTGETISFPETEEGLMPAVGLGGERIVRVFRNGAEDYFSVESIYLPGDVDINGQTVPNPFADLFARCSSDEEIIQALMGHTIRSVQGDSYQKIVRGNVVERRLQTFILLTPPIHVTGNAISFERDTTPPRVINDLYKQFSSQFHSWYDNVVCYIHKHHPVLNGEIFLFCDNAPKIDKDGEIRFDIAIKTDDKYYILRDIFFSFSPILLLEHHFDSTHNRSAGIRGIRTIYRLLSIFESKLVGIKINPIMTEASESFYQFIPVEILQEEIIDDFGSWYYMFTEYIDHIQEANIPSQLLEKEYMFSGSKTQAPFSIIPNQYCVLISEDYDWRRGRSIDVLRWFPIKKKDMMAQHMDFYLWGYIKEEDGLELYNHMVDNSCQVLLARTTESGKIRVLGGIEQFFHGDFADYVIPHFMFNFYREA